MACCCCCFMWVFLCFVLFLFLLGRSLFGFRFFLWFFRSTTKNKQVTFDKFFLIAKTREQKVLRNRVGSCAWVCVEVGQRFLWGFLVYVFVFCARAVVCVLCGFVFSSTKTIHRTYNYTNAKHKNNPQGTLFRFCTHSHAMNHPYNALVKLGQKVPHQH